MVPTDTDLAVVDSSDGKSLKKILSDRVTDLPIFYAVPGIFDPDGVPGKEWEFLWINVFIRWSHGASPTSLDWRPEPSDETDVHYMVRLVNSIPPNQ